RVAVEPFMVCGECPACKKGMYNLCEKMGFIGISGRGGGLAEKIVVEERWVHNVGDIPLDQAALIEPLSVGHHAVAQARRRLAANVAPQLALEAMFIDLASPAPAPASAR
ncbi:alcohol dehydrogenase catalytic domain-containing protein, partial [Actinotignum timonense]|uniref:alcohol dehydrogenase catalytic domain-containing protein n=1 Tax=Actinotignum timonense TaxID=1870995 RepID=UPI002A82C5AE